MAGIRQRANSRSATVVSTRINLSNFHSSGIGERMFHRHHKSGAVKIWNTRCLETMRRRTVTVLEMKPACERCTASLTPNGPATICSYECTFCTSCAAAMAHRCPNCGGELVTRPTRVADPTQVGSSAAEHNAMEAGS
jgi:uncharacterized protein